MPNKTKGKITKKILTESFKKLLAQKSLDKISIKEITEGCGLNRQTFYYHFKDIYDQVEWLYEQEAFALFDNLEGTKIWQKGLLDLFKYIEENKSMCYNTLKSVGHEYMFQFFYDDVFKIIENTITTLSQGLEIREDYKLRITQYFVLSFGSMIEGWVYGYITGTPEELIEFFDCMLQDQMRGTAIRLGKHIT